MKPKFNVYFFNGDRRVVHADDFIAAAILAGAKQIISNRPTEIDYIERKDGVMKRVNFSLIDVTI